MAKSVSNRVTNAKSAIYNTCILFCLSMWTIDIAKSVLSIHNEVTDTQSGKR